MKNLPYKLTDRIYVLGQDLFLTYLIIGKSCALLDLGVSASVPLISKQLGELGIKPESISDLVVLHAHWDHVCGLPYMRELFPDAIVWGSEKAKTALNKTKIVELFRKNDEKYCSRLKDLGEFPGLDPFLDYNTMAVDKVISDGETLHMCGIDIQFFSTPGHSSCSLSAYIPSERTTIISDATGSYDPISDEYLAMFYQSYQMSLDSLKRLRSLEADIVAYCHDTEMIFFGKDNIEKSYRRIEEELLRIKREILQLKAEGHPEEELLHMLFLNSYKGFLTRMYPPEYINAVAPFLLRAIDN
jgi:glyoxylase-like metal-dependent hydrolase (beta-lactamase superfamily II)